MADNMELLRALTPLTLNANPPAGTTTMADDSQEALRSDDSPGHLEVIVYKRIPLTGENLDPSSLINLANGIFLGEFLGKMLQTNRTRVGNDENLCLIDRILDLEQKTADQDQRIADQDQKTSDLDQKFTSHRDLLLYLYVYELENFSQGKVDFEIRSERNRIVHGGDITRDKDILDLLEKKKDDRLKKASEGFAARYDMPISQYLFYKIDDAPKEVIDTVNKRSDFKHLRQFQKKANKEIRDEGIKLCDVVIHLWMANILHPGGGDFSVDGIKEHVKEIDIVEQKLLEKVDSSDHSI